MQKDFAYLQKRIDAIIANIGSEELIFYLDILNIDNYKDKVISFILVSVGNIYKISSKKITQEGKTGTEQRMITSYLLKKYLDLSIRKIGEVVRRKEGPVYIYLKDMTYYLNNPSRNKRLINNYQLIDTQVKEFLQYINKNDVKTS